MEEDYFPRGGREPTTSSTSTTTKTRKEKDEGDLPYHVRKKRQQKKRSLEEEGLSGGEGTKKATIENDFLFGNPREKQHRKKKKKQSQHESGSTTRNEDDDDDLVAQLSANKHSLLPLGGGGVVLRKKSSSLNSTKKTSKGGKEPFIEALGFSRLDKGTKLLGIIREVQEEFALVSLPNLLTGYVLRTECGKNAPPLTHSVSVGQVMAVVILRTITESTAGGGKKSKNDTSNTTTRRRIQVSLEPTAINLRHEEPKPKFPVRGKIRAIEDNGLVVDLGHGRKGFLLYQELDENNYRVKDDDEDDEDIVGGEGGGEEDDDDEDGRVNLRVGSLQDFIVGTKKGGNTSSSSNDIVPLKLPSPDQMAKYYVPSSDTTTTTSTPTIQTVCPGWLVKVKVEAIARNGLCVAFMGNVFRGSIELSHMGGYWIPTTRQPDGSTEWKQLFDGSTINPIVAFTARILAVDPDTKTIRLTVLPHLMDLRPPPTPTMPSTTESNDSSQFLGPGTVLKQCTVIRLDPKVGALLALPTTTMTAAVTSEDDDDDDSNEHDKMEMDDDEDDDEGPDTAAVTTSLLHKPLTDKKSYMQATKVRAVYVHISKAMDEKEDGKTSEALFAKEFAPSTKHDVRVLSTSNLIEGVASGAAAESIIKAHVLTHSDLVPGKIFRNVPVCAHLDGGAVLVEFGMEVRGLITVNHLFDKAGTSEYRTKMMKAKYAIGAKVDVRVLSSDPTSRRCFLTAKKSLLQASDVIDSYTGCEVGSTASGFVSMIDNRGLFVTFFNNVYGRVTARSLALELGIDDHRENYKVGDVVKCRVANIKKFRRERRRGRGQALYDSDSEEDDEEEDGVPGEDERHRYVWELTLSLRVEAAGDDLDGKDQAAGAKQKASNRIHLHAGAVLPEKAMKVVSLVPGREKGNRFVPGYAIVKIKSKFLVDEAESATMLPFVECKLPYDHLQDKYNVEDRESAASLDALASKLLKAGKSVKQKGILLTDPRKSSYEYSAGMGRLTIVSIRPKLVELAEAQSAATEGKRQKLLLPSPDSNIFDGAQVLGFVTHIDNRFGGFVRFLGGLTGLVPKSKGGSDLEPFSTVTAKVVSVDHMSSPPKIVLGVAAVGKSKTGKASSDSQKKEEKSLFNVGDVIAKAEIVGLDFYNANVKVLDKKLQDYDICARIHCTMAKSNRFQMGKKIKEKYSKFATINKFHPFSGWTVGETLTDLTIVSAKTTDGRSYIELTNRRSGEESGDGKDEDAKLPSLLMHENQVEVGAKVTGIVKQIAHFNGGLCLTLGPNFSGFIPGVEASDNPDVLNKLSSHCPVGSRLLCTVIDKAQWSKRKDHATDAHKFRNAMKKDEDHHLVYLSLTGISPAMHQQATKPVKGDLVVGRIQRSLKPVNSPALMLELRGGYVGRCCITEMEEMDEWANMPLGHVSDGIEESNEAAIVSGESDTDGEDGKKRDTSQPGVFPNGMYVSCRVLAGVPSRPLVDVSLRSSRIEGDLEDDELPEAGDMSHAYVVETNKRGCFVRLSRCVEGRVVLKEISDEFLPNPAASFPPGRLVIGKIKEIKQIKSKKQTKTLVDLDMRESTVLQSQQLQFDDVELQSKHKGTVTRVENYGVFVRIQDSTVSGLVHKSECSDKYVKNIFDMYDPGDLVKVLVIKKDEEHNRLGFSMKASHFADDEDSDDDEAMSDEDEDEDMPDVVKADEIDSEDEDFGSKLAKSMPRRDVEGGDSGDDDSEKSSASDSDSDDSDSDSDSDDASSGDSDDSDAVDSTDKGKKAGKESMDTDVGFSWDTSDLVKKKASKADSDSESESDTDDEDAPASSTSHKSRKKQAQKRREEQEISRRETALADGTADDNPETAADFERLLSGSPNSSEIWIRFMAFHLSLADISSARAVAERAFARIEFSEEREKLNVWSALLQLELKYGSASSLQAAIDRACSQNNPKQVYLRVCEMLEKEVNASSPDSVLQADAMFTKMCKKFKSKKKVWIAHLAYLLKSGRHKEAHELSKRSLSSLPEYKHVETMSKFAQLEFEHGSPERARTVFDGIILKHAKRLDLVFVYADKELKFGSLDMARALFERIVHPRSDAPKSKLSDKQMKSLFKKWYRIEEEHGTPESQDHVKNSAKAYVERSVSGSS